MHLRFESMRLHDRQRLHQLKKYADKPFQDTDPMTRYTYYWSPCKDITRGEITSIFCMKTAWGTNLTVGLTNPFTRRSKGAMLRSTWMLLIISDIRRSFASVNRAVRTRSSLRWKTRTYKACTI